LQFFKQGIKIIKTIAFQTIYGTTFSVMEVSDVIRGKNGRLDKLEFIKLGKYLCKNMFIFDHQH
jgi:hypothetical protein